jgi:hypothetical protein
MSFVNKFLSIPKYSPCIHRADGNYSTYTNQSLFLAAWTAALAPLTTAPWAAGHPILFNASMPRLCSLLVKSPDGTFTLRTEDCNADFSSNYTLVCGSTVEQTSKKFSRIEQYMDGRLQTIHLSLRKVAYSATRKCQNNNAVLQVYLVIPSYFR